MQNIDKNDRKLSLKSNSKMSVASSPGINLKKGNLNSKRHNTHLFTVQTTKDIKGHEHEDLFEHLSKEEDS